MADILNYAKEYSQELAQAFPYVLNFGDLYATPNNGRYRIINARTIEIPVISTTGRVDADRDVIGEAKRRYSNSWEPKTLAHQREWSTLVHPMDIDQTNMVASIGNITKVYNEEQKFPEMDAYTISKIYELWKAQGMTPVTATITVDNVLETFDNLMKQMDEKLVTPNGRILYVTPDVNTILKNAKGLVRNFDVQNGSTDVSRIIKSLDLVKLVVVPSVLMKDVYDFTEGWKPGVGAKQIHMVLIHPNAIITPVSYEFATLDEPSAKTSGKYLYYEESHEDVFILNNKKDAVAFVIDGGV